MGADSRGLQERIKLLKVTEPIACAQVSQNLPNLPSAKEVLLTTVHQEIGELLTTAHEAARKRVIEKAFMEKATDLAVDQQHMRGPHFPGIIPIRAILDYRHRCTKGLDLGQLVADQVDDRGPLNHAMGLLNEVLFRGPVAIIEIDNRLERLLRVGHAF